MNPFDKVTLELTRKITSLEEENAALKEQVVQLVRAIDEHMVCNHQGVFNLGDDPKEALNKIACYEQDLGAYFAKEKLEEMAEAVPVKEIAEVATDLAKDVKDALK